MREHLAVVRNACLVACLAALPAVGVRLAGTADVLRRDRLAVAAYQRGFVLQAERRYDEAAAAFREAAAISPRATGALLALGDVEFRRGRFREAIAAYRRVLSRYPYTYIGELHRQVGLCALRGGFVGEAVAELQTAVALDPQDWLGYHLLGHAHLRAGNRQAARAAWEQALRLNPAFAPAREQLRLLEAAGR